MLNPDEYFNRDLKTTLRLGPVARTAAAMRAKAEAFMALLAKTPERVKSYFSCKQVAYAIPLHTSPARSKLMMLR